jgi:hypothetical protein
VLVIYQPVDGDRQQFEFRATELLSFDAEAIEDVGGPTWGTYEDFVDKLTDGNLKARRALLWIMLRRTNPRLRFADLVVRVDEVKLASDAQDLRVFLESGGASPEQRQQAERELAELLGEDIEPEPMGKDEPAESATDSPSPEPDLEASTSN